MLTAVRSHDSVRCLRSTVESDHVLDSTRLTQIIGGGSLARVTKPQVNDYDVVHRPTSFLRSARKTTIRKTSIAKNAVIQIAVFAVLSHCGRYGDVVPVDV